MRCCAKQVHHAETGRVPETPRQAAANHADTGVSENRGLRNENHNQKDADYDKDPWKNDPVNIKKPLNHWTIPTPLTPHPNHQTHNWQNKPKIPKSPESLNPNLYLKPVGGGFSVLKVWREVFLFKGLAGYGLGSPVRQAIGGF